MTKRKHIRTKQTQENVKTKFYKTVKRTFDIDDVYGAKKKSVVDSIDLAIAAAFHLEPSLS